jgi:hypothetical protein
MFLLEGGAKAGGEPVNLFGEDVSPPSFKTLSLCAGGCFTSLFCNNNKLYTQAHGIVINTPSIFPECKLSYCNPLPLILYSDYVCNIYVMGEALLGDKMMIQITELVE